MTQVFLEIINAAGQRWAAWIIAATLNSAALLAVVSFIWLVVRRHVAPQVGYLLFLLVPLKLLLPIEVTVPPQIERWTPVAIASRWLDKKQYPAHGPARPLVTPLAMATNPHVVRAAEANSAPLPLQPTDLSANASLSAPASSTALARPTSHGAAIRPADPVQPRLTTAATAMLLWLGVVTALFCRLVYTQSRFWSRLRRATPIDEPKLHFNLSELARRAGVRRPVRFVECDDIAAPAVSGIIRPTILLPRGIASSLTARQLRWVLLHELAHVRRHDVPAVLLQRCAAILHFFNPIVWLANRIAYRLREYACDDFALATSKTSAVESGQAFLEVLRYASDNRRIRGALGIFGFDSRAACTLRVERLLDSDRKIHTRASAVSMGFVLLLAIVALPHVHAQPEVDKEQLTALVDKSPANLSGLVKSADGKPIEGALVTIYSAGVRVGYSPFCPTCYADCGKRTTTAADGTFTIEKLDPSLVFRVLVVAKGYEPKFATKVDPMKGKELAVALKARPAAPDDRTRVVAGQVFSPNNTPLAGALVEPFGCKTSKKRWWGSMPGVDPLAVSDDNGRFEIVTAEPVEALDLEISARGAATKRFALIPSGDAENNLRMSAGATVTGRLLDQGQPAAGVLVGLAQADRSAQDYINAAKIGTDAEGRFLFTNVPPDREYFVYGIMTSLRKRGGVAARSVKVAGDNTKIDVGDLAVEPAFRIAGRVALSDGKPLPANTRVLFSREDAWDSQTVQADADGNFEAFGIPQGVISITASVPKYHASEWNKSLERLNGTSLKGLVTADIDGLTILLEPGEHKRHDWSKSRSEWRAVVRTLEALKVEPPVGVGPDLQPLDWADPSIITAPLTKPVKPLPKIDIPAPLPQLPAADAKVPQRSVTGRVIDQDGKPIADADVFLPIRWSSGTNYLTAQTKSMKDGTFELKFPTEWIPGDADQIPMEIQTTVWAYAKGHSIGVESAFKQLRDRSGEACEIRLGPPTDTKFTVLLPDGLPAVGVRVAPQHFLGGQGAYDYVPAAIVAMTSTTTDNAGRAALPAYPIQKMLNVNVISDDLGTQQFAHFAKVNPDGSRDRSGEELKLQPVGRIEGRVIADQSELFRDMVIYIETQFDPTSSPACRGQAMVTVDREGRFVIPQIAGGMVELMVAQLDNRLPVQPRLPMDNELEVVPRRTTRIEIPLEMTIPVHGLIRIKGSNAPVAGATISVGYGVGHQSDTVKSDAAGKYTARVLPGKVGMQVIHVPNYDATQLSDSRTAKYDVPEDSTDFELPPIELTKTKTLSGRLLDAAGKPLPERQIFGINGDDSYGFGRSDKNGDFKLTGVPEGMTLEKFKIWTDGNGAPLDSIIDSTDPLVVRLK